MSARKSNGREEIEVTAAQLQPVRDLYERGLYLQAYEAAKAIGPFEQWVGSEALIAASRLVANLGASILARRLILHAYRRYPHNLRVTYAYLWARLRRRGPLVVWHRLERLSLPAEGFEHERAGILGLRARVTSSFRDFQRADWLLQEADRLNPASRWLKLERAYSFEDRDDYARALSSAEGALGECPNYRPALQAVAHFLQLLSRDAEALQLLRAGLERFESEGVAAQLAALEAELGLLPEAMNTLRRFRVLTPLLEGREKEWWHAQMSDVHYQLGDYAAAAEDAREVKGAFFETIARRLADVQPEGRRVHLQVGFVRQHRMTCAPATLSALSQFWDTAVDHLSLAAAICYDGTPDHVERHWAEQHGWKVAEFKVTWDTTRALLDHGIPFTVTTVETETAHLQAVIGYDTRRGTLLIRDPYDRVHREFTAEPFFERYAASGPRGMVLLPAGKESLLHGLELPDAERYDHFYRLRRALERHAREAAQSSFEQLQSLGETHRLAVQGRRTLALYDANEAELLAGTEELLRQFPEHSGFLALSKLASLRDLGRSRDYLALLKEKTSRKDAEPTFLREYAREILEDASQRRLARHLITRATYLRPVDADNLHVLAGLQWEERDFTGSIRLYRLAACVGEKTEYLFRSYFRASRQVGETEEALAWLRRRFEQHGRQSSLPARTLVWALNSVDRTAEAMQVLDEALLLRPGDGELLTFAADENTRIGQTARATELLKKAKGRAARGAWLRASGGIAENQTNLSRALAIWREVLALEPLAMDANRAVAWLLAEVEGREAALCHLEEVCARFSHHVQLHKLWLDWTRELDRRERILRLIVQLSPEDAWTRRELALLLADSGRFDEAHAELRVGCAIEPLLPGSHSVTGRVLFLEGRNAEARDAYRQALRLSIDSEAAMDGLLAACVTAEEKRDALAFIFGELKQQVSFGDGLRAYREVAWPLIEPGELLAHLQEALAARPDLWHAWSAVVAQLSALHELDQALDVARAAMERFPMLPRLWFDLAAVYKARRQPADEVVALRRAIDLNPSWSFANRELSAALERVGDVAAAEEVLRKAIVSAPSDAYNHGCLADLCWRRGAREEAIAEVQRAVILEPDYTWGWQALRDWSAAEQGENLAAQAARELVAKRSGESRCWLRLAEALQGRDKLPEQLDAVDRALALNPRNIDAWDLRATLLAEQGKYQEALGACTRAMFGGDIPPLLKGRAAWVDAQRGRLQQAITSMRAVVEAAPDYYWGWARLTDWYMQREEPLLALDAAEQMSRLQPHNVAVLGYIGDARLALDRRNEAREVFTRAWDLDPLYGFAAQKLFELQLQDRDFRQAEATVQKMKRHLDDAEVAAAEVRLAAAQRQKERAFATIEALCRRKGEITYALHSANDALTDAGWGTEAEALFRSLITRPEINAEAGAVWVKQVSYQSASRWWRAAYRLRCKTAAEKEALTWLLNSIGEEKRRWLLRFVLWRFAAVLRADDRAWGNVTYAAANIGDYRQTIAWMQDWRSRAGVQPWMLINLASALRHYGREAEARDVSLAATSLPVDHTTGEHFLMLALDAALAGDFDGAETYREDAGDQPPKEIKFLIALLDALFELHRTEPSQRRAALKEIRSRLSAELAEAGRLDRASRRAYRKTLLRLAEEASSPLARIGAYFKTLPTLPVSPHAGQMIRALIILLLIFNRPLMWIVEAFGDWLRSVFLP